MKNAHIVLALIALVTLTTATHAQELGMIRLRGTQAHRALTVSMAMYNLIPKITPEMERLDPKLRGDIARVRDRAGNAYSKYLDQQAKLRALQVGGDPNVVNDVVKAWAYRKTAMVMQTLAMTSSRNETEIARIEVASYDLETRFRQAQKSIPHDPQPSGGQARNQAITLLGAKAE